MERGKLYSDVSGRKKVNPTSVTRLDKDSDTYLSDMAYQIAMKESAPSILDPSTARSVSNKAKKIIQEVNPQAIDRLASAIAKLGEQERILSGRPLPGSQRPRAIKASKVNGSAVEPE